MADTEALNETEIPTEVACNCKVLLVDDQAIVAEAIRRMLSGLEDIEFSYCQDPDKAVDSALEWQPTVILQDLVMPDVDGFTLLKRYRETPKLQAVPVIVLSTKEDPVIKKDAFESEASDYLVKLPDRIELIARIRAHSRSYLAQKQRDEAMAALKKLQVELEKKNAELERLSSVDGLTGIPNRRSFDSFYETEWNVAVRERESIALMMIDIDYFKKYNDGYGHQAGDDCLRQVAQALDSAMRRPTDLVGRYGGEEFVVVLPRTDVKGAEEMAEQLRAKVEQLAIPHEFSDAADHVSISIGVSVISPALKGIEAKLVAVADKALYEAKEGGRNRFHLLISEELDE